MSTLRNDQPVDEEVQTERGELRKPGDRHNQPGQGADLTPPNDGNVRDPRHDPGRPIVDSDPSQDR